jgi:hypothetical protein
MGEKKQGKSVKQRNYNFEAFVLPTPKYNENTQLRNPQQCKRYGVRHFESCPQCYTLNIVFVLTDSTQCDHNSVVPEPEGSSPHSQQPAIDPYPQQGESTPHPPTNLPKIHFDPILPSTPRSSNSSLSFGVSHQNPVHVSPLSQACYMLAHLILLYFICLIFGDLYKL